MLICENGACTAHVAGVFGFGLILFIYLFFMFLLFVCLWCMLRWNSMQSILSCSTQPLADLCVLTSLHVCWRLEWSSIAIHRSSSPWKLLEYQGNNCFPNKNSLTVFYRKQKEAKMLDNWVLIGFRNLHIFGCRLGIHSFGCEWDAKWIYWSVMHLGSLPLPAWPRFTSTLLHLEQLDTRLLVRVCVYWPTS